MHILTVVSPVSHQQHVDGSIVKINPHHHTSAIALSLQNAVFSATPPVLAKHESKRDTLGGQGWEEMSATCKRPQQELSCSCGECRVVHMHLVMMGMQAAQAVLSAREALFEETLLRSTAAINFS
jgi:hypothetical protein